MPLVSDDLQQFGSNARQMQSVFHLMIDGCSNVHKLVTQLSESRSLNRLRIKVLKKSLNSHHSYGEDVTCQQHHEWTWSQSPAWEMTVSLPEGVLVCYHRLSHQLFCEMNFGGDADRWLKPGTCSSKTTWTCNLLLVKKAWRPHAAILSLYLETSCYGLGLFPIMPSTRFLRE